MNEPPHESVIPLSALAVQVGEQVIQVGDVVRVAPLRAAMVFGFRAQGTVASVEDSQGQVFEVASVNLRAVRCCRAGTVAQARAG